MTLARIYFSADEAFLDSAADELRAEFPDAELIPIGRDLGAFMLDGVSIATLAETITRRHLAFTRHLMRGVAEVPNDELEDLSRVGDIALDAWEQLPFPDHVSLQVWQSGDSHLPYRSDQLWHRLESVLADVDVTVARGGAGHVLSACVTEQGIIFGSNSAANALSDWPGGRVKLAKPKGQISRAEFKLEELLRTDAVALPTSGRALDLGAAPGGWTRLLLDRGFEVWAVDPAELDPRLRDRPGLHHVRTTAGPFLAETDVTFDLIVNDMRMAPRLSANVMVSAANHVAPGGLAIMSVKLQPDNPLGELAATLTTLRTAWDPGFVRQLHHNRHEVTVVARKRHDGTG